MLLVNNNIKATPVLCLKSVLGGTNCAPAFLLKTHSGRSILRLRRFRRFKAICIAARSNSLNRGKCIAGRSVLGSMRFSQVCAYKPGPVVITITGCTRTGSVVYRISLRGAVTYNVKTYLYYIRGAGSRRRIYMYARKPMFGVRGLA